MAVGRKQLFFFASLFAATVLAEHAPVEPKGDAVDTYYWNSVTNEVSWEDPGVLVPYKDETTERFYWVDPATGDTTWERPNDNSGWTVTWDEEHKRHFWHNDKTKESTWTPPENLAWEHVVYKEGEEL